MLNNERTGIEPGEPDASQADRLRRRRIKILLAFPAAGILAGLWFAEFENVLAARLVVQGTRHPLIGFLGLLAGFVLVGMLALIARQVIRFAIPPMPGDRHVVDQLTRWVRGGPDEAGLLRARAHVSPLQAPRTSTTKTTVLIPLALIAFAAVVGLVAYELSLPSFARHSVYNNVNYQGPTRIGSCSPGPCASVRGTTVYVRSVQSSYLPTDLSPKVQAFEDNGDPPGGHRWVRVVIDVAQKKGAAAFSPAASLRLLDGQALHYARALPFDPACQRHSPDTVAGPGALKNIPLCFIARATGPAGGLYLEWLSTPVRIPIGN